MTEENNNGLSVGKNVVMHLAEDGHTLVIKIDLNQQFGLSTSGKSITVASTGGNVAVPGHEEIKLGLNVYRPANSPRR